MKRIDMTGMTFGELTVIDDSESQGTKRLCLCSCGKTKVFEGGWLRSGRAKSCGRCDCRLEEKNGILFLYIKYKKTWIITILDTEDKDIALSERWCFNKNNGYILSPKGKLLSRVIMDAPDGMLVDHVNRNKLDNRRSNLRLCTASQNVLNQVRKNKNKTGYKGIYLSRNGTFIVRVSANNKVLFEEVYKRLNDAIQVRDAVRRKLLGDFCVL